MENTESDLKAKYSLLGKVEGAEKAFLKGRRNREADLESAVSYFLEFLRGFESFDFDQPCVTVFGSARFEEDHRYYQLARELGQARLRGDDGRGTRYHGGRQSWCEGSGWSESRLQYRVAVRAKAQSLSR